MKAAVYILIVLLGAKSLQGDLFCSYVLEIRQAPVRASHKSVARVQESKTFQNSMSDSVGIKHRYNRKRGVPFAGFQPKSFNIRLYVS